MLSLALALLLHGCSVQTGALVAHNDAEADSGRVDTNVGFDTSPVDSSLPDAADTARPTDGTTPGDGAVIDAAMDTGPTCTPTDEVCNGSDDDCDLEVDEAGCDCDREVFGGHVYLFCTSGLSFALAESACAGWGYHLLHVEAADEQGFAWSAASSRIVTDWWLGLSDRAMEDRYTWTDGTVVWEGGMALGYHAFRGGAPDDTSTEDCFELDGSGGPWAGAGCDQAQPYVCEAP